MENPTTKRPWYKKWWGIAIIAIACLVLALALALGALSYRYWQLIKSGHGDVLQAHFYGSQDNTKEQLALAKVRAAVETDDDPTLGSEDEALITIVEFIDFKCPICKKQNDEIKKIVTENNEQVKLIVRDFPVESTHRGANELAIFASCANSQGIYWPVHDYFFTNQDSFDESLSEEELSSLINRFNLNREAFLSCFNSSEGRVEVNQDYASGLQNGLTRGTPTFFVNGYVLSGYVSYDQWQELIKSVNQN